MRSARWRSGSSCFPSGRFSNSGSSGASGYIIGFLLSVWSGKVVEHGEQLILLAGCVLFCVGVSSLLHVSAMITNLTVGATVVNLSERSRHFLDSLSKTDPPLYAIFF